MIAFSFLRPVRAVVALSLLFCSSRANAEEESIRRATFVRLALLQHPAIRANEERVQAASTMAKASSRLPPPEAMLQIWQVPLQKPYAIADAAMVMVGLGQTFPAPGSAGARERAGEHMVAAAKEMGNDRLRTLRRDAEHAFADYVEATSRHAIHMEHRAIAKRAVQLARARHAAGGAMMDVASTEVELARVESDVIGDGTRVVGSRARLNVWLGRDPNATLAPALVEEAAIGAWDLATEEEEALRRRPEIRAASAEHKAAQEQARAASREASLPSFSLAALYFAPVGPMPTHGYGANASMTLPWLWGDAAERRDGMKLLAQAAKSDADAALVPIRTEVALADTNMRSAALKLQALRDLARPASQRAFDAAWAGYEAGRTDVLTLLTARRAIVDVDSEVVAARAALDHALADLEAAVGTELPRRPLGPLDATIFAEHNANDR
jgi:outer membrane protein TolC